MSTARPALAASLNRLQTVFSLLHCPLTVLGVCAGGVWVMQSDNSYNLSSELRIQDQLHTSSCSIHDHLHVYVVCSLLYSLTALLLDYCINFICVMLDTNIYRLWKLFSPCVRHSEVSSNSFIESYSVQRTQVILQSSGDLMINLFQGLERLEIFLLSVSKSIFLQFWWYFIK